MKKMVLVVSVLTLVAFVAVAMAQQKPAPAAPATTAAPAPEKKAEKAEKPKAAKVEKMSGTVEKVDEMAKSMVVKDKKGEKTFMFDDKTKITKGGKDMPLADLKPGTQVSVSYKKDGDKMMATAIMAAAPKAPAKEKAPAKAPEKPAEAPKK